MTRIQAIPTEGISHHFPAKFDGKGTFTQARISQGEKVRRVRVGSEEGYEPVRVSDILVALNRGCAEMRVTPERALELLHLYGTIFVYSFSNMGAMNDAGMRPVMYRLYRGEIFPKGRPDPISEAEFLHRVATVKNVVVKQNEG